MSRTLANMDTSLAEVKLKPRALKEAATMSGWRGGTQ